MAETETAIRRDRRGRSRWVGGAVAGLVAGVCFGLYLQFVVGVLPPREAVVAPETLAYSWVVHLFHSLAFALVYVGVVSFPRIARFADRPATGVALGAAFGVALWAVATGVAVAFWAVANTVLVLPIPDPSVGSLVGHVLYGAVLGTTFAVVRRA
ncbi:hypothetical protein M0R88_06150 [Halorussus gelatinilyticus]|uniref:Histidine kinase n=1 Tax=Halorussus gelatinilyticus TaxID=2937524 RepID=A0A8U0IKL9_9EURY|nr:hypothetical protein [Halorussus gelatinilyticus]UPW01680.1 hypothetical protein M0R88_06150 [Halorussus gelatinilyticus]